MSIFTFIVFIFIVAIVLGVIQGFNMSPEEALKSKYGPINPNMACPHCNTTGKIRTKPITQKKGVSGGKATAAVFTAGISLLATGLSRKENNTQAHCVHCSNTCYF